MQRRLVRPAGVRRVAEGTAALDGTTGSRALRRDERTSPLRLPTTQRPWLAQCECRVFEQLSDGRRAPEAVAASAAHRRDRRVVVRTCVDRLTDLPI
jgi:hypothetical protein